MGKMGVAMARPASWHSSVQLMVFVAALFTVPGAVLDLPWQRCLTVWSSEP
jgi:hypothetical protein